ncbi:MAG TPA: winged helix-turn-helix transcriptional regulator [Solirubrobacterales bacterium]|nr:winged helix-turn-helix transcriptional regulator [Solirubrobacterales bacterium]
MGSRQYGQACSLAYALDRIGERWTLLIVRELSLGPMRFSALVRAVGGAPTDILTKRLRELEQHGIVVRRELPPPASATVYELTALGRGLERPMVELGRWGMGLQKLEDVIDLAPSSLPSAIRVILQPPPDFEATLGLRTDGEDYWLRIEGGWTTIGRGPVENPDLLLAGAPIEVIAALVVGEAGAGGTEVEGDRELLERLRAMVVIPDRLRAEAEAAAPSPVAS